MEQDSQKREAEETEFQMAPDIPTLCANNCGFFGSSVTNNLCSKCYKDAFLSKSKAAAVEAIVTTPALNNNKVSTEIETKPPSGGHGEVKNNSVLEEGNTSGEGSVAKKPSNRCSSCNKRVGLMGFKCRCGEVFCSLHRYSDKHNCLFDYKGAEQDAIAKANPMVKADKVEKI